MIDVLERLDTELDTTPPEAYTCRPPKSGACAWKWLA